MVSSPPRPIRIGSRKSQLALVQTYWVQEQLQQRFADRKFEVHTMSTQGDKILDFAVHSLKDLPTRLPEGLMLGCVTEREDPADALVVHANHQDKQLDTLPEGAVVGTSSLRRLAQLRYHYPHLAFKDIRGNLNTRLQKLDDGEYDAIILAVAGLKRLGMGDRIHQVIPSEVSLHAVGQGALGIECRADDEEIIELLMALQHQPTAYRCYAERSFLRELEGGCQVPIGVNTTLDGDTLTLTGMVASVDGKKMVKGTVTGQATDAEAIGIQLAKDLRGQGATEILEAIFAEIQRG
jgi:hydroxymethylbilane synthase